MAFWKLSPQNKKSAVEQMFFYNAGKVIIVEQGWRWGTFTVESDERPLTDLELVNAEGYELGCIDNDESWDLYEMTDGCWLDVTAGRNATEQDVTAFEQAWEEDGYDGVEELGWSNDDTEYYYYGPLELTNEDTGEVFKGESGKELLVANETLEEASEEFHEELEVTDWFPINTNPARQGSYQVTSSKIPNWPFPSYAQWDGVQWSDEHIVSWRGLLKEPE